MRTDPRLQAFRSYRPPTARGPHRPSAPSPTRSADLVSEVLGRIGGRGRALEFRVFDCYSRVVGETLRTRTMPERLVGTTLFIRASNSAMAHELTLLRADTDARGPDPRRGDVGGGPLSLTLSPLRGARGSD
jgi:hypothetical protein